MSRHEHDFYTTPVWAVKALGDQIVGPCGREVFPLLWEPYAGTGIIGAVLEKDYYLEILSQADLVQRSPVNPHYPGDDIPRRFGVDCTHRLSVCPATEFPLGIVANPPYTDTDAILKALGRFYDFRNQVRAIGYSEPDFFHALLLRRSALEPTNHRGEILLRHPPRLVLELPRFSMRRGKSGGWATDSTNLAWIVWTNLDVLYRTGWACVTRESEKLYTRNPEQEAQLWGYQLPPTLEEMHEFC